ncbi:SHOCT domain-containing protein [Streptomyces europaeiscabiei]|uniref:SHOCT domain-containing protein n=1 Tax=Streptomyces TaxID=1883 RepID=UPI000A3CCF33|nr:MULTISPECIES: SHOCT domain-containing protein [Streptomyces]MDX3582415.1 SHOCT domain-containing protein [Streptomyces europaeiscabiei]MDX3611374.1 SHOCT domain-containing protein [Streptomyces europaeiscabiei]MDX3630520.1 SHOCT domain-containing protein [Streptomyces europaeiscabiei]MDX3648657.1 SHOCT domain-containing protein [Streptomyces europaeiscabiei]WUD30829.1 SHOCT domain-containing protein [Streptomyces europaeiscabiei]
MSGQTYLAYDYPLLSVFWSMLLLFLWIMWFVLLFRVVVDIFRDDDMSGWAKAGWLVFTVLLPFLGVFVYVIARGKNMGSREVAQARAQQAAFDSYVRETARSGDGHPSSVDELARLSEIRSRGDITDDEFRRAKELVLSGHGPSAGTGAGPSAAGR